MLKQDLNQRVGRDLWPIALILTLAILFFFSYFNRFIGLRSGDGEFNSGIALLAGRLPYRDYYTAGPPLNQLKSALELALLGKTLFVSRFCAVVERLAIAVLLYAWLRRLFSSWVAATAALTTIIISACDHADPLASYNHDSILFAMLCGLLASLSTETVRRRNFLLLGALAGTAAGLSSLTKQTVGLGTAAAVLLLASLAFMRLRNLRSSLAWGSAYLVGFAAPLLLTGVYLERRGLLRSCLRMLFITGPAAKASMPHAFLLREVAVAVDNPLWVVPGLIATVLSTRAIWWATQSARRSQQVRPPGVPLLWLGGLIVVGGAELLALTTLALVNDVTKCAVYYTLFTGILLLGAMVWRGLRERSGEERTWQIALFAGVSCSVALTLSLSWPAFEAMTLPGLGLLLAAALEGATAWGRRFVLLVIAVVTFLAVNEKLRIPFSFDHQTEAPVRFATAHSNQPMLSGMRLPMEAIRMLDETTTAVQAEAPRGGTIFTYPEMGLIYSLADRQPPTWSGSHNIDVVPDPFAREEARRLARARPWVILYARPSGADLRSEEAIWRAGNYSGQRDLVSALDVLVHNDCVLDTFLLQPEDTPIRLYVRRAR